MLTASADGLALAYAARRCVLCGGAVSVTCVGSDAVYERVTTLSAKGRRVHDVLIRPAVANIDLCLAHAAERWPWASEVPRARKGKRA